MPRQCRCTEFAAGRGAVFDAADDLAATALRRPSQGRGGYSQYHALICGAAGLGLRFGRSGLGNGLGRIHATRVAPGVGGGAIGNVAERSLIGALGLLVLLDLAPCLLDWSIPVFGDRFLLGVSRRGQQCDDRGGVQDSHAYLPRWCGLSATRLELGRGGPAQASRFSDIARPGKAAGTRWARNGSYSRQGVSESRISIDIRLRSSDISVMTETTAKKKLPAAVERFVLHWGDMGDEWGVNRSVSQIHGLLYLSEAPMTADDIAETLGMARSNVSNSIRELLSWNLIRRVPIMGDRRDHYEAETDIWEVAARIAAGRKEREIDPAVDALRACVVDAADDPTISPVASKRLKEMLAFTELVDRWYTQMLTVPRPRLIALIKLGEKIVSLLPAGKSK